ncbi:MAG: DUF354 domain-containing protein [Chlorobiales bacterium]|nr:DUF354 domain-containing protein [Chlorobiales bacterium]
MRVWIDIDNSPHVPFFDPIIKDLMRRDHDVIVSSRQYAQTRELLQSIEIPFIEIGEHAGKSKLKKLVNLGHRATKLAIAIREFKPDVAVSHGSRAQSVAAKMLGIPKLLLFDYEWTEMQIFKRFSSLMACPSALSNEVLLQAGLPTEKIYKYGGFKEEVYLPSFQPDQNFRRSIAIPEDAVFVVVRPSSMTSNYHDVKSEVILRELLNKFALHPDAYGLIIPRTEVDKAFVSEIIQQRGLNNVRIAQKALPGLQLLYWADLVISGGGTMNREAALLGTPTFSIFTGRRPAIDEHLRAKGKLTFIESPDQINDILFRKNSRGAKFDYPTKGLVREISDLIEKVSRKK